MVDQQSKLHQSSPLAQLSSAFADAYPYGGREEVDSTDFRKYVRISSNIDPHEVDSGEAAKSH